VVDVEPDLGVSGFNPRQEQIEEAAPALGSDVEPACSAVQSPRFLTTPRCGRIRAVASARTSVDVAVALLVSRVIPTVLLSWIVIEAA
jgi:hypothetical protein